MKRDAESASKVLQARIRTLERESNGDDLVLERQRRKGAEAELLASEKYLEEAAERIDAPE